MARIEVKIPASFIIYITCSKFQPEFCPGITVAGELSCPTFHDV